MDHRTAIESLANEVSCPICRLDFEDPRILPCGHYYCKECIVGVATNAHPNLSFPCPECRRGTRIPEGDAANLPKALFLNRVKSVLQNVFPAAGLLPAARCVAHGEPSCLYCTDCEQSICQQCTTSDHLQHRYEAQALVFTRVIEAELAKLSEEKERLGARCQANQSEQQRVQDERARLSTYINQAFEELVGIVQKKKAELLSHVDTSRDPCLHALAVQKAEFQAALSKVQQLEENAGRALQNGDQLDETHTRLLLHNIDDVIRQCAGLNMNPRAVVSAEHTEAQVNVFSDLRNLLEKGCKIFQVADLSRCTLEGFQPTPTLMQSVNAAVHVKNSNGEIFREKKDVSVTLVNVSMGTSLPCNVFETRPGVYEFSYCAVYRGRHHLTVEVDGQAIPGSPFKVFVNIPPTQLGRPFRAIEVHATNSIAFGSDNLMMVNVGGEDARVVVMDTQGKHLLNIQSVIRTPNSLAVDSEDNIYAVDFRTFTLQKFSIQGHLLKSIRKESFPGGQFSGIGEIRIIKDELVFVCDTSQHKIHVLDKDLVHLRSISCTSPTLSHPCEPSDLVYCKVDQQLFVADCKNKCILVYSLDGALVRSFGRAGLLTNNGHRLEKPWSVCLDQSESFLFVLDYAAHQILTFTTAGRFVVAFGSTYLQNPARVAVDKDGYVYVCDEGGNKIIVF